jgi:hypothetical protein
MERGRYLEQLEARCGRPADYFHHMQADGGPQIGIIGFDHYPDKGCFTYFSHGLHLLARPEWKTGRPEYFITIDRPSRQFAAFFAYLISAFANEKVMGWNTLIGAGDCDAIDGHPYRRIALGPPQYLGWPDYRLDEEGALPIFLGMAYYISDDDFVAASEQGFGYLGAKMEEDHDYWRRILATPQDG